MSSLLSAELSAACNALGCFDIESNRYYADSNTLETAKDLIRYLRRDDDTHDIRRQLGETKVLQTDLLPLLKSYFNENELFDVLLRLLVNLTTPALILWNEVPPIEKIMRNHYLQIEGHLQSYKESFVDESIWAIFSEKLSKILEIDHGERGEENGLVIERIFILVRNILYVPMDPDCEKRPDNDASIQDQVLWALHQSGMVDIILYVSSTNDERAYYMHIIEILCFMLREQNAGELAKATLERSETEKMRDEAELLALRHRESNRKQQKVKSYNGARHSRFGGTYVFKSMKAISDNELIYHKPLNKLDALNFDANKKKVRTPKNRLPLQNATYQRRSAFGIRLFLRQFCVEFLNAAYNTFVRNVRSNLAGARAQANDASYLLWCLRFFMEFNRCYKFEVKLVSETLSLQTFHYIQQECESYFDRLSTDKQKLIYWSRRLHLALQAYRELLLSLSALDRSADVTIRKMSDVIKSNVFYVVEYRELILTLLFAYDELKMSDEYLRDLIETQHVFVRMLETFSERNETVVVQKKTKRRKKKKASTNPSQAEEGDPNFNLEIRWDEASSQLSALLEGGDLNSIANIVPFDAASDVPIDEQKEEAMKNIQRKLRNGLHEEAVGLLRASREVWPENDCFGSSQMAAEDEFLALREIYFADLGDIPTRKEAPIYNEEDNEEDEDEDDAARVEECELKVKDFIYRLANPKIVRACGLALKTFATNSPHTNYCIVRLLHRIAFDCKLHVMVFQVSIFQTFRKIFQLKEMPQYKELVKFATYIVRQFIKVAETNKKVYIEALFWSSTKECCAIEQGYDTYQRTCTGSYSKAWSEEEEDKLRRLFMEHQQNNIDEDVVEWIVDNFQDDRRTHRNIHLKLKKMHLLPEKTQKKSANKSAWLEEEVVQLGELYEQFKDSPDPLGSIEENLTIPRPRNKIKEKLLEIGLIQSKTDLRKKRQTKKQTDTANNSSKPTKSTQKRAECPKQPTKLPDNAIRKLLHTVTELGMSEALDWVRESLRDALEDFEDASESEGIPLVPIMGYAVDAMELPVFHDLLKGLGLLEPYDEQVVYWRIPYSLGMDNLERYIDLISAALEGGMEIDDEENNVESDDDVDGGRVDAMLSSSSSSSSSIEINNLDAEIDKENGNLDENNLPVVNVNRKKRAQRLIESDSEDEVDGNLGDHSLSDGGNRGIKRARIIVSSDED